MPGRGHIVPLIPGVIPGSYWTHSKLKLDYEFDGGTLMWFSPRPKSPLVQDHHVIWSPTQTQLGLLCNLFLGPKRCCVGFNFELDLIDFFYSAVHTNLDQSSSSWAPPLGPLYWCCVCKQANYTRVWGPHMSTCFGTRNSNDFEIS